MNPGPANKAGPGEGYALILDVRAYQPATHEALDGNIDSYAQSLAQRSAVSAQNIHFRCYRDCLERHGVGGHDTWNRDVALEGNAYEPSSCRARDVNVGDELIHVGEYPYATVKNLHEIYDRCLNDCWRLRCTGWRTNGNVPGIAGVALTAPDNHVNRLASALVYLGGYGAER